MNNLLNATKTWLNQNIQPLQHFSQASLHITSLCQLQCIHCPIWQNHIETSVNIKTIKKLGHKNKTLNIFGGDPFLSPDIFKILVHLKKQNNYIKIWTPGITNIGLVETCLPLIDELFLYLPNHEKKSYLETTGQDRIQILIETISLLKENQKKIYLNHFVDQENIQYLPEIHEFAWQHKLKLVIHYFKNSGLSKESLSYIKRFKKIKNIQVFSRKKQPPLSHCPAFPFNAIQNPFQILANIKDDILNRIQSGKIFLF